jgi:iron complex outermembrane recepter protein
MLGRTLSRHRHLLLATTSLVAVISSPVFAQSEVKSFDIPAQSASTGLPMFGQQAGVKVLATGSDIQGVNLNAVKGRLSVNEGLSQLLQGTNLKVQSSGGNTILISALASVAAEAAPEAVEEVVVVGIRSSQKRAVSLKRSSSQISDSISSEDIGKFPDATISDSLQRIPGVQVRREAGEAGAVNIRGLPQVAILLNGEAFLGANSITSVQANFGDIPSQLMAGADVFKTATANQVAAGISGTVNLRTWKPFDFKQGLTLSGAIEGSQGSKTKEWEPNANVLGSWRNDRFGILGSIAYSDLTSANFFSGRNITENQLVEEPAYVAAVINPTTGALVGNGLSFAAGDQNGDGDLGDIFLNSEDHSAYNKTTQRQRLGVNFAFQYNISDSFKFNAEAFHTEQTQWDRIVGINAGKKGANYNGNDPVVFRNTGIKTRNPSSSSPALYDFNTVQVENFNTLRLRTWSEGNRIDSKSDNISLGLRFNDGGKLTYSLRYLYAKAEQNRTKNRIETDLATSAQWGAGTGFYPNPNGGVPGVTLQTNPNGYSGLLPITVDYRGDTPTWSGLNASLVSNVNNYGVGAVVGEDNYDRKSDINTLRFDANYEFDDAINLDFGLRFSDRKLSNDVYDYLAPLYPTRSSNGTGCLVKWVATDINIGGWAGCRSGDPAPGGTYTALQPQTLASFGGNVLAVNNFGGVSGIPTAYAVNPEIFDSGDYFKSRFPGAVKRSNPDASYDLSIKQTTAYVQVNADTVVFVSAKINLGFRILKTELTVNQREADSVNGSYGGASLTKGKLTTDRSYTEFLPALNAAFDLRDDLKLRLAASKNSTMLDGAQWGGGLRAFYALNSQTGIFEVVSGASEGNPQLKPWRSTNLDASLEWYNAPGSLFSIALFNIDVESFPQRASISASLPDADGVIRRTITIPSIGQGSEGSLRGVELSTKQAFTYLPGFWSDFGVDANVTYSPSKSKTKDITGDKLPFQDNSELQTNLVVWYQSGPLQARIAYNYRSERFVQAQAKISNLATYQEPTSYVDASVSYDVRPNMTVYLQGSNLTEESEQYYIHSEDQKNYRNGYERRITAGLRAKF